MNTHLVLSLDTRKAKKRKDGTFPVIFRLTHFRKTTSIPTGISVQKEHWDAKKREIRKGYKGVSSVSRLNNQLSKKKAVAMDIITGLDENGKLQTVSLPQLKKLLVNTGQGDSFNQYTIQLIKELEELKKFGTAKWYKDCIREITKYNSGQELNFSEITYNWLRSFEKYYLGKGNSINSLSAYMRALRAILNKAIRAGVIEKGNYPFDTYRIRNEKTRKRAVSHDVLKAIVGLGIEPHEPQFHARNYFLASYLMNGMNFTDMAYLKMSDMISGRIYYKRKKTGRPYDIKISDTLAEILSHYTQSKGMNDYVFPILKRETPVNQFKDIQSARRSYNKSLKKLGRRCGIEETLTSYVPRHSFATEALLKDVPVTAISAMLGHSSIATTEIYLKTLPSNLLDEYSERVGF